MPIPASKKELQSVLKTEYEKLVQELLSVPEELLREKTVEGGISVSDIIAYQIGWGELLLGWYTSGKKGKVPPLPHPDFKWNQLGELAKYFHKIHEHSSYKTLLKKFDAVVKKVNAVIDTNTDKQLYTLRVYCWTDKWPLGRWINLNTSSPYKSARAKIRKWKKLKGIL